MFHPQVANFWRIKLEENGVNMVNWLKAIGDNFTVDYLLVALFSSEDLRMVCVVLNSYGFVPLENVRELVVDFISFKKTDIFGDN